MEAEFELLSIGRYDAILGLPWFAQAQPNIDWKEKRLLSVDTQLYATDTQCFTLDVKLLSPFARLPTRSSPQAVGYDLHATEDVRIKPHSQEAVPTGLAIKLPEGTYGRVAPRSGLALRQAVDVHAGVIDPDYRGEVCGVLYNHGDKEVQLSRGDRFAQLIVEKVATPMVREVKELDETKRGTGGFGSTG
ncbi:deoxyuridine 5'-triphosphate nucleotidohydrolase, partial [Thamnocephalis sphaerospora]